jgi:pimeloyl-ACP methyl ester carboxylesterase
MMDPRGAGHSHPSLDCSETAALEEELTEAPTGDSSATADFTAAIRRCFERVSASSDPSAYDETHAANDVRSLVAALGLKEWNAASYGAGSRVALRLLDDAPPGLRSMVLDSPELPGADPRASAVEKTRRALDNVLAACAREHGCSAPASWDGVTALIRRYDDEPVERTVTVKGTQRTVRYDGAMVARLLRYMLSSGGSAGAEFSPAGIPALLRELAQGHLSRLDRRVTEQIATDPPYCVGYLPKCESNNHTSLGPYLTSMCNSSPADPSRATSAPSVDAWSRAFDHGPYATVCDSWKTASAVSTWSPPVDSDIPVLVTTGSYDPFVDTVALEKSLDNQQATTFVNLPWAGYNVLGEVRCALDLRNRWIDDPGATDTCEFEAPAQYFLPSIN